MPGGHTIPEHCLTDVQSLVCVETLTLAKACLLGPSPGQDGPGGATSTDPPSDKLLMWFDA